jgi:hypothetical protein
MLNGCGLVAMLKGYGRVLTWNFPPIRAGPPATVIEQVPVNEIAPVAATYSTPEIVMLHEDETEIAPVAETTSVSVTPALPVVAIAPVAEIWSCTIIPHEPVSEIVPVAETVPDRSVQVPVKEIAPVADTASTTVMLHDPVTDIAPVAATDFLEVTAADPVRPIAPVAATASDTVIVQDPVTVTAPVAETDNAPLDGTCASNGLRSNGPRSNCMVYL